MIIGSACSLWISALPGFEFYSAGEPIIAVPCLGAQGQSNNNTAYLEEAERWRWKKNTRNLAKMYQGKTLFISQITVTNGQVRGCPRLLWHV